MTLIGLYSPVPQSGKSTVAHHLVMKGYRLVSFAAPIKKLVMHLLTELGYSGGEAHRLVYSDKEEIIPELRTTARHMMQTMGTEYGRQCIHPLLWLKCAEVELTPLLAAGLDVVVDDVRFPNEADLLRGLGGELWRVERPGTVYETEHVSEGGLEDYDFDLCVSNDSSVNALCREVDEALSVPEEAAA